MSAVDSGPQIMGDIAPFPPVQSLPISTCICGFLHHSRLRGLCSYDSSVLSLYLHLSPCLPVLPPLLVSSLVSSQFSGFFPSFLVLLETQLLTVDPVTLVSGEFLPMLCVAGGLEAGDGGPCLPGHFEIVTFPCLSCSTEAHFSNLSLALQCCHFLVIAPTDH